MSSEGKVDRDDVVSCVRVVYLWRFIRIPHGHTFARLPNHRSDGFGAWNARVNVSRHT